MQLRSSILQTLADSDAAIGAYEIAARISDRIGKTCHPNSIYRALKPLVQTGAVHQIAVLSAYKRADCAPSVVMWLICGRCSSVRHVEAAAIHDKLLWIAQQSAFKPAKQHAEVIGICARCAVDEA
jgi:Fur family transcriptional regulator, zinc uptake regulator